jgi:hypothetical protein
MEQTFQAIIIGALVGFVVYNLLLRKKLNQAFESGAAFGIKEGFDSGFPQGVVLSARNIRSQLAEHGIDMEKEIDIEETQPGLYKILAFVEVKRPGQDDVTEGAQDANH